MAAPSLSHIFAGIKSRDDLICTLTASTTVGLERLSQQECEEKFNVKCLMAKGRIFFDFPVDRVNEVFQLRSVDNVSVLLGDCILDNCIGVGKKSNFSDMSSLFEEQLGGLVGGVNWTKGLSLWKAINCQRASSSISSVCSSDEELNVLHKNMQPKSASKHTEKLHFRVKCDCICGYFVPGTAESVAQQLGQALQRRLAWVPDGGQNCLEVELNVRENYMYVSILLGKLPQYTRSLKQSNSAAMLRPSVAYNLLRLAGLSDGETICDLTATGNCFQAEAHHNWPQTRVIRGVLGDSKTTLEDSFQWDGVKLPLQDNCVDVVLTQVPIPSSPSEANGVSFPLPEPDFNGLLSELARVTRRRTGRAVLLTYRQNTVALVDIFIGKAYCDGSFMQVYGIQNLRVADASIMPNVVAAHPQAACMVIVEKIVGDIKRHLHSPVNVCAT